jgi:hypothetical protein
MIRLNLKKTIAFFVLLNAFTLVSFGQTNPTTVAKTAASRPVHLSDSALLDLVQKQTFKYFWDFAHPVSGLARERSNESFNYGREVVTIGGTGFGVMAIVVATSRNWITRDTAVGQ